MFACAAKERISFHSFSSANSSFVRVRMLGDWRRIADPAREAQRDTMGHVGVLVTFVFALDFGFLQSSRL